MELPTYFKKFSSLEIAVLVIFIIYLVLPLNTPSFMAFYIDTPLAMVLLFVITLYLFFFTNPVLGVLFIFVAYEILRRSSLIVARVPIITYVPSEKKRDEEMILMNPPQFRTLEEEVVSQRAPVDVSRPVLYEETTFKPVYDNIDGASMI